MASTPRKRARLGTIWQTQSGTWSARYEHDEQRHTPGHRFPSFKLADEWLKAEELLIARDQWTPPAERRAALKRKTVRDSLTFGIYADRWLTHRQVRGRPIRPRTAEHYRQLLDAAQWLHRWHDEPLTAITRADVARWYDALPTDRQTARGHAYGLFRAVMTTAVRDGLIQTNPVDIPGATVRRRAKPLELPTPTQIDQLTAAMPPQHALMVPLAAWAGLRFGELAALRRSDFDLKADPPTVHVARGIVTVGHKRVEGPTKSDAGDRVVILPSTLVEPIRDHLKAHAQWGRDGLLFPSTTPRSAFITHRQVYGDPPEVKGDVTVSPGTGWYAARHSIGRDDLPFHALRHHAGTMFAAAGGTLTEDMAFLGHDSPQASLRYQHAGRSRMQEIAARMSAMAGQR